MERSSDRRRHHIQAFIDAERKSPILGFVLALVLGPIGCLYAYPMLAGIYLMMLLVFLFSIWPLAALLWFGCALFAPYRVRHFNRRIRRKARWVVH